jgi:alpha-beta hydrolase superfamily lysophospholipase
MLASISKVANADMKILFLHGWISKPGGVKATFLATHGHQVVNPALPDEDFDEAVRIAQAEFDRHNPDIVVGVSRGGAIAMNITARDTPLVLLCPAWKKWNNTKSIKPSAIVLHSRADEVIPFAHSEDLVRNSGVPRSALIEVGSDHRLADPESLAAMLRACERALNLTTT